MAQAKKSAHAPNTSRSAQSQHTQNIQGYALAVARENEQWNILALDASALTDVDSAAKQVKNMRSAGPAFALLNVDDEFFIIIRPTPAGNRMLLSDATAAIDYEIAEQVLQRLNIDTPDLPPDQIADTEPWGEGDFGILEDVGLPEPIAEIIVSETDLYADEQLESIAERLGCEDELIQAASTWHDR